ncbi:hypothetical protein [Marinobacter sp. tcs-11]|uniref:hypothetical protein n=1 Tax=Marinobacter sp. tcs-11 TaxID=1742860 RepID=UPI00257D26A3|nr:hypothetical protein [Marinobacter sp. tcs-11]
MYQDTAAALDYRQGSLPFDDVGALGHSGMRAQPSSRIEASESPAESDSPFEDLSGSLLRVGRLSDESAKRMAAFSSVVQRSFDIRRHEDAGHIVTHFTAAFTDFWYKRYAQYSCTKRFLRRVAKVFNLSPEQATATQAHLDLPNCVSAPRRALDQHRFSTCLYMDDNETVRDPLARYYDRTVKKQSTLAAWDSYLARYAYLSPDMLNPADIRFLLRNYPVLTERMAMLLQVRPDELAAYADDMNFPQTYRTRPLAIRDLIGHEKHQRLTRIVIACAQMLYTHQAIPLKTIAERIGVDIVTLYTLGEKVGGDWVMPTLNTVHHVIEITTLLHVESGGVLRQNVNG